ncbi:MAG: hypothetical protein ABIK99_06140 [candidate division WOR-3 bacterium]
MVGWWLEFDASQPGAYEKANERFWRPLGVERRIIRKGHPEDNPFVVIKANAATPKVS